MSLESYGAGLEFRPRRSHGAHAARSGVHRSFSIGAAPQQQAPVNHFAQSMVDFQKRVDDYMKLRGEITKKVPEVKETGDPPRSAPARKALGKAIAKARATAKAGDVFGAEMSAYLKKILAEDWKSRSAADRKALFEEIPPESSS